MKWCCFNCKLDETFESEKIFQRLGVDNGICYINILSFIFEQPPTQQLSVPLWMIRHGLDSKILRDQMEVEVIRDIETRLTEPSVVQFLQLNSSTDLIFAGSRWMISPPAEVMRHASLLRRMLVSLKRSKEKKRGRRTGPYLTRMYDLAESPVWSTVSSVVSEENGLPRHTVWFGILEMRYRALIEGIIVLL